MPWILLMVAGVFEVIWATSLKASGGFSRLGPSVLTIFALLCSFIFLAFSLKNLPVGTAYAVWTGIGAVGTTICGIVFFHDTFDGPRAACLLMIVAGIAGLRLLSPD